jgi:hypothetical protein
MRRVSRGSLAARVSGFPPLLREVSLGSGGPPHAVSPATRTTGYPPSRSHCSAPRTAIPSSRAGHPVAGQRSRSRALRPAASASLAPQAQTLDSDLVRQGRQLSGGRGTQVTAPSASHLNWFGTKQVAADELAKRARLLPIRHLATLPDGELYLLQG